MYMMSITSDMALTPPNFLLRRPSFNVYHFFFVMFEKFKCKQEFICFCFIFVYIYIFFLYIHFLMCVYLCMWYLFIYSGVCCLPTECIQIFVIEFILEREMGTEKREIERSVESNVVMLYWMREETTESMDRKKCVFVCLLRNIWKYDMIICLYRNMCVFPFLLVY